MRTTEQSPQGQPVPVPQDTDDAESITRVEIMRGQCERALAAWFGPPALSYDYAWRVKQLTEEWRRLIYYDDLPRRICEAAAAVKDRADAKRVIRALLRRLDRIEGQAAAQDPANEPDQSAMPATGAAPLPDTQPPAEKADATPKKKRPPKATVNQRMTEIIEKNPESLLWTITQWTARLRCGRATIHEAPAYQRCQQSQEAVRRKRMEEQRKWQDYKRLNE